MTMNDTERWVVYEWYPDNPQHCEEISWHKTLEKAQMVADAEHSKTDLPYSIDLCLGTGGANASRWVCEEAESDVYEVGFDTDAWKAANS
jgi:hypothetical protein